MNYKEKAVEALSHLSSTEINEVVTEISIYNDKERNTVCNRFITYITYIDKVMDFYKGEYNKFLELRQAVSDNPTANTVKELKSFTDNFYQREQLYVQESYDELERELENIDAN